MPIDVIVTQLVNMLSSENSDVKRSGADTLSVFAQYGQHRLAWKSFSISHKFIENMRALMRKDVILTPLINMLASEDSDVKRSGAETLLEFAKDGQHVLA